MMVSISPLELKKRLDSNHPPHLLNIEAELSFEAGHIAGSLRSALYEMGFAERVEALIPGKSTEVVIYGTDADTHGNTFAAEKLSRAGFTSVLTLEGGLEAWSKSGYAIEGELTPLPVALAESGVYEIDLEQSHLRWVGRNLANFHEGKLGIKAGSVSLKDGGLENGQLVIDMKAIECSDIADTKFNRILITHLEDHDFFDAGRFPEAEVRLGQVKSLQDVAPGQPNYIGEAILTLRGVEHEVAFALAGGQSDDQFSLQGALRFDRTDWGGALRIGSLF
tara:strand:+ start:90636 stop:91472 length:837 start_codon:yes stop_codon:yes gene_type:complete